MLINLVQILDYAKKNNNAVGAFNTPNYECSLSESQTRMNTAVQIPHL